MLYIRIDRFLLIIIFVVVVHLQIYGADRTLCSPGFKNYGADGKPLCIRFFSLSEKQPTRKEETWDGAHKTCKRLQSHLLYLPANNSHFILELDFLRHLSLPLIWFNLRRETGLYMSKIRRSFLFRISENIGSQWQDSREPLFDCVALNVTSWKLVTSHCHGLKLPFICLNFGFSTKPTEHIACPEDWFFTQHLMDPYGCIRVFPPTSYNHSLETCTDQNSTLLEAKDFHGIYHVLEDGYLSNFISEGAYWVEECRNKDKCEIRAKVGPPKKTTWRSFNSSDLFPLICKQDLKNIDVRIWISQEEESFQNNGEISTGLVCNANIGSEANSYLKYLWLKDGIPVSVGVGLGTLFKPSHVYDESKISGDLVTRQGVYQCFVEVLGFEESFPSNVVDIFFPDVASYILNINITRFDYQPWEFSRSNIEADNSPKHIINWKEMSRDLAKKFPLFSMSWDIQYKSRTSIMAYTFLIFFNVKDSKPKSEDMIVYPSLMELQKELSNYKTVDLSFDLQRADCCFPESINLNGTDIETLYWPMGFANQKVASEPLCLTREGHVVYRECIGNFSTGASFGPMTGDCFRLASNITNDLYQLTRVPLTSNNAVKSVQRLVNLTASPDSLEHVDVEFVASTLNNIANKTVSDPEIIRSTASVVSNVMNVNKTALSGDQNRMNTSNNIIESFEKIVSVTDINGTNLTFSLDNVAVGIWQLNLTDRLPIGTFATFNETNLHMLTIFDDSMTNLSNYEAGITIPLDLVRNRSMGFESASEQRFNSIIYRNASLFLYNRTDSQSEMVSPVVHASIGAKPITNLHPPVNIYFKHIKRNNILYSGEVDCVYWNQTLNDKSGAWSSEGCSFKEDDGEYYICQCNHLTNFAALLNWPNQESDPDHDLYLSIISRIGCSLSLFGLGMTILTYALFRKWRKGRKHHAIVNLSVALMSVLILFLAGFYEKNKNICLVVAILLHYFMLATFSWMLVEAVIQYLNLITVFNSYVARFMTKAMLFAWGVPLLIVSTVLIIDHDLYNNKQGYCWLAEDAFYFAFALPALTLLTINFFVFALILYSITCGRDTGIRNNQNAKKMALIKFRTAVCIYFLLGLSWVFGFIAIDKMQRVCQYLFAITTTLQGFMIFVFFVYREKAAKEMWSSFLNSIVPSTTKSTTFYSTKAVSTNINNENRH